jgi:hypothetical protein
MTLKKAICVVSFAAAVLATPVALDQYRQDNLRNTWADGGAPTPPPIPLVAASDSVRLIADGGAPTPPPIPLA